MKNKIIADQVYLDIELNLQRIFLEKSLHVEISENLSDLIRAISETIVKINNEEDL